MFSFLCMKPRLYFTFLFCALACFIFYLSTQDAPTSSALSITVTSMLLDAHVPDAYEVAKATHHIFRDLAHVVLFGLLGFICMTGLIIEGMRLLKASLLTLLSVFICALIDESIQLFSTGRAFEVIDLAKDLLGGSLSIIFVLACYGTYNYLKHLKVSFLANKEASPKQKSLKTKN